MVNICFLYPDFLRHRYDCEPMQPDGSAKITFHQPYAYPIKDDKEPLCYSTLLKLQF